VKNTAQQGLQLKAGAQGSGARAQARAGVGLRRICKKERCGGAGGTEARGSGAGRLAGAGRQAAQASQVCVVLKRRAQQA